MKPTIHDVAKRAGLSVVTVSRVLNNVPSVREENRQKVLKAIEELNYQPNAAARILAMGKTGVIGVLIPTLDDSFMAEVARNAEAFLEEREYFMAISLIPEMKIDWAQKSDYLFQQDRVDGFLVVSPHLEDEEKIVLELKKRRIPFVLIDNQQSNSTAPSVVADNFKGGYEATSHLIELGHQKIGHIEGTRGYLSAQERKRGYLKALEDHGINYQLVDGGAFDVRCGYEITKKWLKEANRPTAIFAADDQVAFGVIDAAREMGLRVPGDLSVVGYDDHPFASMLHPFLTTVRQPAVEMSQKGVELLMKQIDGEARRKITYVLEPQLIIRDSTRKLL